MSKAISLLTTLSSAVSIPILVMNIVSGIVGGLWLAVLKEWQLIIFGIVWMLFSHWIISLFLIIRMPIEAAVLYFFEKDNKFMQYMFAYLSILYTNLLIIGTCAFSFFYCLSYAENSSIITIIPYLLWSWGMALGPWRNSIEQSEDNETEVFTVFFASFFYLLFLVSLPVSSAINTIVVTLFILTFVLFLPIGMILYANAVD